MTGVRHRALRQKNSHPDKDDDDDGDRVFDKPGEPDPRLTMPLEFGIDRRHTFLVYRRTWTSYSLTRVRHQQLAGGLLKRLARVQQGDLWSPPSVDLDLVGDDPYAALGDQTHGERIKPMLDAKDPSRQACLVVIRTSRHNRLSDDRSGVDLRANEMHSTTGEPHARRQRAALRAKAGKGWQQRRMDLDHPVAPCFDESSV